MNVIFYIAALVAIVATARVITSTNAVHALLYLIVSLLAVAVIFFVLGAPFLAAFEIITYAGAIMILLVFTIMMLNLGKAAVEQEKTWLEPRGWIGPGILTVILLVEFIYVFARGGGASAPLSVVSPREVGETLFGPYVLGVEMVALLLMAAIVGAFHIGGEKQKNYHRFFDTQKEGAL